MNKLVTETECVMCEEATYEERDGDVFCPNCHTLLGGEGGRSQSGPWRSFWSYREQSDYHGWKGPDRIKMVGGFASAYDEF